jgi:Mg2+ and Co2+ transporter CorA
MRENWSAEKSTLHSKITTTTQQKLVVKVASKTAKKIDLVDDSLDKLLKVINKTLSDAEQFNRHLVQMKSKSGSMAEGIEESAWVEEQQFQVVDTKRLNDLASTLDKTVKLKRLVSNVIDAATLQKLEIDKERLQVEKSKAKLPGEDDEDNETGVVLLPEIDDSLDGDSQDEN